MYAGISGMKNFQTKLDVVGNNIANVNTTGFKKGRVTFQDMMSQTMSNASGPTEIRGGMNPAQVGLGSQTGSIDNIQTQGSRQTTNRELDVALEGDGMLVFGQGFDANDDAVTFTTNGISQNEDIQLQYSRAGNLYLDNSGNIVNTNGQYLIGYSADDTNENIDNANVGAINIPDGAESFSIQGDGTINYVEDGQTRIAGQISLAKFSNPGGLQKVGGSMYQSTLNAGQIFADANGNGELDPANDSTLFAPETNGTASIVSGSLEMSNVDLAEEFTEMITAQRAFQSNTKIITTSDEILQELVNLKR